MFYSFCPLRTTLESLRLQNKTEGQGCYKMEQQLFSIFLFVKYAI